MCRGRIHCGSRVATLLDILRVTFLFLRRFAGRRPAASARSRPHHGPPRRASASSSRVRAG
eukprot:1985638-Pleurochrysis_carterae.AAC.1